MKFEVVDIVVSLICAFVILLLGRVILRQRTKRLPPGPLPWPVIGNLLQLTKLPHRGLGKLAEEYGPLMYVKFGSVPTVIATSPDMAKEVLKTQVDVFSSRGKVGTIGKILSFTTLGIVWAPYGPHWRLARRICAMELFTAKRIQQFELVRKEEMHITVQSILSDTKGGGEIELDGRLLEMNHNIITRMVFNKRYGAIKNEKAGSFADTNEFTEIIVEGLSISGIFIPGDYFPWLDRLDLTGVKPRLRSIFRKWDNFLTDSLEEHRQKGRLRELGGGARGDADDMQDFVDVLLSMQKTEDGKDLTDDNLKSIVKDLIVGGTDTSSNQAVWIISELMKNEAVVRKLHEELSSVVGSERFVEEKDLPNLPYLQAVVKEGFRLHPVIPFLPYGSAKDSKIAGYDIPKGTRVFVNVFAIQRDPKIWENPLQFDPERFIGSPVDVRGNDFNLLPFGSGRRMCPGMNLGLIVLQLSVAQLIHSCQFSLPKGMKPDDLDDREAFGLTTPRLIPLRLGAAPRLPLETYRKYNIPI